MLNINDKIYFGQNTSFSSYRSSSSYAKSSASPSPLTSRRNYSPKSNSPSTERLNTSFNRGKDGIFRPKSLMSLATEIDYGSSSSPLYSSSLTKSSPIAISNPRLAQFRSQYRESSVPRQTFDSGYASPRSNLSRARTIDSNYLTYNDKPSYTSPTSSYSSRNRSTTSSSYLPASNYQSYRFTTAYYAPKVRERPLLSNLRQKFATRSSQHSSSTHSTGGSSRATSISSNSSIPTSSSSHNSVSSNETVVNPRLERNKFLIKFREHNHSPSGSSRRRSLISWDIPGEVNFRRKSSTQIEQEETIQENDSPLTPEPKADAPLMNGALKPESVSTDENNNSLARWSTSMGLNTLEETATCLPNGPIEESRTSELLCESSALCESVKQPQVLSLTTIDLSIPTSATTDNHRESKQKDATIELPAVSRELTPDGEAATVTTTSTSKVEKIKKKKKKVDTKPGGNETAAIVNGQTQLATSTLDVPVEVTSGESARNTPSPIIETPQVKQSKVGKNGSSQRELPQFKSQQQPEKDKQKAIEEKPKVLKSGLLPKSKATSETEVSKIKPAEKVSETVPENTKANQSQKLTTPVPTTAKLDKPSIVDNIETKQVKVEKKHKMIEGTKDKDTLTVKEQVVANSRSPSSTKGQVKEVKPSKSVEKDAAVISNAMPEKVAASKEPTFKLIKQTSKDTVEPVKPVTVEKPLKGTEEKKKDTKDIFLVNNKVDDKSLSPSPAKPILKLKEAENVKEKCPEKGPVNKVKQPPTTPEIQISKDILLVEPKKVQSEATLSDDKKDSLAVGQQQMDKSRSPSPIKVIVKLKKKKTSEIECITETVAPQLVVEPIKKPKSVTFALNQGLIQKEAPTEVSKIVKLEKKTETTVSLDTSQTSDVSKLRKVKSEPKAIKPELKALPVLVESVVTEKVKVANATMTPIKSVNIATKAETTNCVLKETAEPAETSTTKVKVKKKKDSASAKESDGEIGRKKVNKVKKSLTAELETPSFGAGKSASSSPSASCSTSPVTPDDLLTLTSQLKPKTDKKPVEDAQVKDIKPKKRQSKKKLRFREYTIDDFTFLKVLGRGSFGKVLLAELNGHNICFAVKCLKKQTVIEDDDVESIMIERKVLAFGSSNPFICKLFCTFQTESHLFFAMEWCAGGDLMFHVQKEHKFSEEKARFYVCEILCALWFMHKRGIIYRDLKLDNIMVYQTGHIRMVDFGMCQGKMYREELLPTCFCGTPEYMAPEIIKGVKYNHSVDYWALGVVIYELCVGTSPFQGTDEDELLWNVCNQEVHYPKFLSEHVKELIVQLLKRDPKERLGMETCQAGPIRSQAWLDGVNWDLVERGKLKPPFVPELTHEADVSYFDRYFTNEEPCISPNCKPINEKDQLLFEGFTYTNHNMTE